MYAYEDTAGWHNQTIRDVQASFGSSIAVDKNGNPHVIYLENHTDLVYAVLDQNTAVWNFQIVDTQAAVIDSSTLRIDSQGVLHTSYALYNHRAAETVLKYAFKNADAWKFQNLDTGLSYGESSSLALDENEFPHISYTTQRLKYVFKDASGWYTPTVVSSGSILHTSIAIDGSGHAHICYSLKGECSKSGCENGEINYTYQDVSGWNIHTLDEAGSGRTSIAVDDHQNPHVIYFTSYGLKYAYLEAGSWQFEILDRTEGLLGGTTSLVLDSKGYPHISYINYGDNSLKYVFMDAGEWHSEILDDFTGYGYPTVSMSLDNKDYAHISYLNEDVLAYLYQDAAGWHTRDVVEAFSLNSLALDEDGTPHIMYIVDGDLMYAYLPAYNVALEPSASHLYSDMGATMTATLTVNNRGAKTDSYKIDLHGYNWPTTIAMSIGPLAPVESQDVDIQVTIPPTATLGSSDTATITLTSQSDPSVSASATLTTYAALTTYLPLVER